MGLAANAGTIYLAGGGTANGKTLPGTPSATACVAVESDNNVYTFTVKDCTWLKISMVAAGWNDGFNNNGFCVADSEDYVISPDELGKELKIYYGWANNINPPSRDEYTYTLTVGDQGQSNSKLVVSAVGEIGPITYEAYVVGQFTGWGAKSEWQFSTDDNNVFTFTCSGTTKIPANSPFKIADANWGPVNFGGSDKSEDATNPVTFNEEFALTSNGGNLIVEQDFEGTITFNLKEQYAIFQQEGVEPTPSYPENLYIVGDFQGEWAPQSGIEFDNDGDGSFSLTGFTIEDKKNGSDRCYIAFFSEQLSWDDGANGYRYGAKESNNGGSDYVIESLELNTEEELEFVKGEISWGLPVGIYTITVAFEDMEVTFEKTGDLPETSEYPTTMYVIGTVNGHNFAPNNGVVMDMVSDGVFNATVKLGDENESGKAYFSFAERESTTSEYVDMGLRYGPSVENQEITKDDINKPFDVVETEGWSFQTPAETTLVMSLNLKDMTLTVTSYTGITNIAADENAPVEYYNLQGVRVANPENGIFIVRQGSKVSKVVR